MTDAEFVEFMQQALPRVGLSWPRFRRVRRQVRRRVRARIEELGLPDLGAYDRWLVAHEEEQQTFRFLCRITISRFYRDRPVWDRLRRDVFPKLTAPVAAWSAGCASGEEPYTLSICFALEHPSVTIDIVATDFDPHMLERARVGVYPRDSLRDLPDGWAQSAFDFPERGDVARLRDSFREPVTFREQDLLHERPDGPFDLIFCRNLAFTYLDDNGQRAVHTELTKRLKPTGVLVIGKRERVPV